jgi:hypothetical protein
MTSNVTISSVTAAKLIHAGSPICIFPFKKHSLKTILMRCYGVVCNVFNEL